MNIPELSINPLAHRLERIFESVNFKVASVKAQLDSMNTNSATVTWPCCYASGLCALVVCLQHSSCCGRQGAPHLCSV